MIDVKRIGPRATATSSTPHRIRTIKRPAGAADAIALAAAAVYAGALVYLIGTLWEVGPIDGPMAVSTPLKLAFELTMLMGLLVLVRLLTRRPGLDAVSTILQPRVLWIGAVILAIALLPLMVSIASEIGLAQRP